MGKGFFTLAFGVSLLVPTLADRGQPSAVAVDAGGLGLKPTSHPRLPGDLSQLWLVPAPATGSGRAAPARAAASSEFVAAVKLEVDSNFAKATGNPAKATEAFSRLVYEFPFSDLAVLASDELENLPIAPIAPGTTRYKLEFGRAERLFGAKRYAQARTAFEGLRHAAQGDDREIVQLRLAESDYFLNRPRNARDGVKPYIDTASRPGEAPSFYAVATRELGDHR